MIDRAEGVVGLERARAKVSHVTPDGEPRVELIDGVRLHRCQTVSHADGHLTEIIRAEWEIGDLPIVQVHATTAFPGRIRAWGLHLRTVDRLFVAVGSVKLVCYDGRAGSPTFGRLNEFFLGERNPGVLLIPSGIYHGLKNLGAEQSLVISMPSEPYDHTAPDSLDLPWDAPAAQELIPYRW